MSTLDDSETESEGYEEVEDGVFLLVRRPRRRCITPPSDVDWDMHDDGGNSSNDSEVVVVGECRPWRRLRRRSAFFGRIESDCASPLSVSSLPSSPSVAAKETAPVVPAVRPAPAASPTDPGDDVPIGATIAHIPHTVKTAFASYDVPDRRSPPKRPRVLQRTQSTSDVTTHKQRSVLVHSQSLSPKSLPASPRSVSRRTTPREASRAEDRHSHESATRKDPSLSPKVVHKAATPHAPKPAPAPPPPVAPPKAKATHASSSVNNIRPTASIPANPAPVGQSMKCTLCNLQLRPDAFSNTQRQKPSTDKKCIKCLSARIEGYRVAQPALPSQKAKKQPSAPPPTPWAIPKLAANTAKTRMQTRSQTHSLPPPPAKRVALDPPQPMYLSYQPRVWLDDDEYLRSPS